MMPVADRESNALLRRSSVNRLTPHGCLAAPLAGRVSAPHHNARGKPRG
jgi:hypothetical protein